MDDFPTFADIQRALKVMTVAEKAQLDALLLADPRPWRPLAGAQTMAYESDADVIGYGGAAGGGKSDLACGMAITAHSRVLMLRREKAQTEGLIQRLAEICGGTDGYSSQKSAWRVGLGSKPLIEFGGLDNLGDERRWQGRPHDLLVLDEATEIRESQARFVMGWVRTTKSGQKCQVLMTFNPPTTADGRWIIPYFAPWLDKNHPHPAKDGELRWFAMVDGREIEVKSGTPFEFKGEQIIPRSRTFISARLNDNPYLLQTNYMAQLQALPEPLRSQMLRGDFSAGIRDSEWQVIPTEWVELAMSRWKKPAKFAPMDSIGVDVSRGGKDSTVIARRHGMWFDELVDLERATTEDGSKVAAQVLQYQRDAAPIHLDIIGVGASPFDFLTQWEAQVIGVDVSVSTNERTSTGHLGFFNTRSLLWWRMREALDPAANNGITLPKDKDLAQELCSPLWSVSNGKIKVESRDDIVKRIKRSPDRASALILALMETPKYRELMKRNRSKGFDYDPLEGF